MSDTESTAEPGQQTTSKYKLLEHSPVSRRNFMRFSAAAAGTLAYSGTALGDHQSPKASELYDFIRDQVSDEYTIPTLILLSDESGFEALKRLGLENDDGKSPEFMQTTNPRPAVYAQLTPGQADVVLELSEVKQVEFSPGSNPFWKLGNYESGVFPPVADSVDYIGFEQMVDGFKHLEEEYSDRVNFFSRNESPGYQNLLTGEQDPQNMWFVELTNNIDDDESFKQKEKPIFSLSIHGDEHQGRESGVRLAERILTGDEPKIEKLLDEVVIIFVFTNPDGWIVRNPQYIDEANEFHRENGADRDLNRSYPTEGWIAPDHYSGEPWGANVEDDQLNEIDDDVPDPVVEHVSDALGVTEQLRSYNNINTIVDMHGQGVSSTLIHTLSPNSDQFDHPQQHDLNEMTRVIGESLHEELGSVEQNRDVITEGVEIAIQDEEDVDTPVEELFPEVLFSYGSSVDTLGYTTTGGLRSFVAGREEFSGLDEKSITIELAYSAIPFNKNVLGFQVRAYTTAIQAVVEYAATTLDATIGTDGRSTAYITTDAVTRSSDDLVFASIEQFTDSNLETRRESGVRTLETIYPGADETRMVRFTVAEKAETLVLNIEHGGAISADVRNSAGETVRTYNTSDNGGNTTEWTISDPAAGEWTVHVTNTGGSEVEVTVTADEYLNNQEDSESVLTPDPVEVLGFQQQEYEVTPFQYFEDNSQYLVTESSGNGNNCGCKHGGHSHDDSLMEPVSVNEVVCGALFDGDERTYDNVVVIHDKLADNSDCLDQLDAFVEAGGNLVLTDTGVQLLSSLDTDLASDITDDDVQTVDRQFALIGNEPYMVGEEGADKNLDHWLLEDVRPVQQELWNVAGLGYASPNIEAVMTLVDADAFKNAGGEIAGMTDEQVSVGTFERGDSHTGIQVIGGALPPAHQRNLHPFGMLDYGIEFLGHTILLNALGYEQRRFVNGELVEEWQTSIQSDKQ